MSKLSGSKKKHRRGSSVNSTGRSNGNHSAGSRANGQASGRPTARRVAAATAAVSADPFGLRLVGQSSGRQASKPGVAGVGKVGRMKEHARTKEIGKSAGQLLREGDADEAPTKRQMEIYAFIRDKIHSRGYGPTVREIGQAFKIRSPNGVVCHLKALERKGLITRGRNMSRAIELVNEPAHLRGLPMAGWVAAGTLRPAEEQSERIDFETLFNRDNHFVLKVMGDSMIEAQIADGDWVVIQQRHSARSGDIVVAQTDDGEATLKQWFPERDRIRLQPANAAMKPIYVRQAKVLGVLVGVVRKT
jgi:repressor LexA